MAVDDSYTKALLHFNGIDTSTTFRDESGKTWTGGGTAQLDTAQKKLGTASLLLDGNSDYISTPDHADFDVGSGDFTIDFWVRFNAIPGQQETIAFFSQRTKTSENFSMAFFFQCKPQMVLSLFYIWVIIYKHRRINNPHTVSKYMVSCCVC